MNTKISFIGVGNMAGAIIRSLENAAGKNAYSPDRVGLFDKFAEKMNAYSGKGFFEAPSLPAAVEFADYIVLSVKPQNYAEVLDEIRAFSVPLKGKVFISLGAGISIDSICKHIGDCAVVRTMPNTPLLIGRGVTALTRNAAVSDRDFESICRIFAASGDILTLDEKDMNGIISVTSSSPAYVYTFIKALYDGAHEQGIDNPALLRSICKMIIGSAEMVLASDKPIDELIEAVRSKGGTTDRALIRLAEGDFEGTVRDAMQKCTDRAEELSSLL